MPKYHITREERIKIEAWKDAGETNGDIAKQLGRDRSSIGRELRRNIVPGKERYVGIAADKERIKRRATVNESLRKLLPGSVLASEVEKGIKKYWSPEQVVGSMRLADPTAPSVCPETVYQYIYNEMPELKKYLRCRKGKYRRRYGTKIREKQREEASKKRIDTRPKIIDERKRIGDFEGDTIVGKEKTVHILTHTDRKSGYLLMDKLGRATADEARRITTERFKKIPKKKRNSITYDNGVTFAGHEQLERDLKMDIYFAYPYHSWERATNENTNGLIRQFLPKGSAFKDLTKRQITRIENRINNRPRKRLGYHTPQEVFSGCCNLT
jgi:IS30 family transposase